MRRWARKNTLGHAVLQTHTYMDARIWNRPQDRIETDRKNADRFTVLKIWDFEFRPGSVLTWRLIGPDRIRTKYFFDYINVFKETKKLSEYKTLSF